VEGSVEWQHADVEHVGVRDEELRALADCSTLGGGGIAVIDIDCRGGMPQGGLCHGHEGVPLVLRKGLGGEEEEGACSRVLSDGLHVKKPTCRQTDRSE
jgi:hypothetical protein